MRCATSGYILYEAEAATPAHFSCLGRRRHASVHVNYGSAFRQAALHWRTSTDSSWRVNFCDELARWRSVAESAGEKCTPRDEARRLQETADLSSRCHVRVLRLCVNTQPAVIEVQRHLRSIRREN